LAIGLMHLTTTLAGSFGCIAWGTWADIWNSSIIKKKLLGGCTWELLSNNKQKSGDES
jgi:hypothetical protein